MPQIASAHPVAQLYALLDQLAPYPKDVVPLAEHIGGTAFFPGGSGLWGTVAGRPFPPMPVGGVMVLGHNFDCEAGFARSLVRGSENLNGPTWRTIRTVLTQASIPLEACFFTNAYMGLKAGSQSTGLFPGARDADFIHRCRGFFLEQVRRQQPHLLLTLGKEVPPFLAPLAPELERVWAGVLTLPELDEREAALVASVQFPDVPHSITVAALTHPVNRKPNVAQRKYHGLIGDAAEQALLQDALERVGTLVQLFFGSR